MDVINHLSRFRQYTKKPTTSAFQPGFYHSPPAYKQVATTPSLPSGPLKSQIFFSPILSEGDRDEAFISRPPAPATVPIPPPSPSPLPYTTFFDVTLPPQGSFNNIVEI